MDYVFMDDKGEGMPILVLNDRTSGMMYASVVPRKGVDSYAVKRVARLLTMLGYRRIIFKSDNEPAILALQDAVARHPPWASMRPTASSRTPLGRPKGCSGP